MKNESPSTNTVGKRIRLQRRVRCLTQKQLADSIGVTQSAVARWEADEAEPALRHRKQIASILDVSVTVLFVEDAA